VQVLLNVVAGVPQDRFYAQLGVSMTVQEALVILLVNVLQQQLHYHQVAVKNAQIEDIRMLSAELETYVILENKI